MDWLDRRGVAPYRADQIWRWVYQHQADAFEQMTNLNKELRKALKLHFSIQRLETARVQTSTDGSKKYLFRLPDGFFVESVLMPERDHYTLCISSQVGCAQGCRFCLTGKGGLARNLNRGEIVSQVRDIGRDIKGSMRLTNIVLMGMGEPLANYKNVVDAMRIITDSHAGLGFASRRITLSTAGLVPQIKRLGNDTKINLAISLNAADDLTRSKLMPINRRYPIKKLLDACRGYPLQSGRRITFEYVLLKGVNDTPEDARQLARLLHSQRAKINIIPFNDHKSSEFSRPEEAAVLKFQETLLKKKYTVIIRESKGQDISAACGQLRALAEGGSSG
jgi:23S rRNA (adenine2503-C2)-methyltransferase